jgi:Ras-related GTP-binding protein A/B
MTQPPGAKLLLMGRAAAGKTSMKSIIFANYLARDTSRLQTTNFIEHSSLKFLGNLRLNLWDCGGQDVFMENYFESQRENIFQNAQVLIYVVSVSDRRGSHDFKEKDNNKELVYFSHAMESLRNFSPNARVFVLIHKLDLVHESKREEVLQNYERELINAAPGIKITCFGTSIWDETLFKAWSQIVYSLIPDINELEQHLQHICNVCEADEVVLFEKNTFLLISHFARKNMQDSHRFEKISNIVKQFKLSCGKVKTSFRSFQVKNSLFAAFIEPFLNHSFVMVVISDPNVTAAATTTNLWAARTHFSELAKSGASFGAHL